MIEYLVVDPGQRRGGVGSGLLQHVLTGPKRPAAVLSACSPNAKGMIALLKGFGFKRSRRAAAAPNLVAPYLFELGLEGPRAAGTSRPAQGGPASSPTVKSSGPSLPAP
jgi:ribosomal protein S18 acetylase RimI-like enzyme